MFATPPVWAECQEMNEISDFTSDLVFYGVSPSPAHPD